MWGVFKKYDAYHTFHSHIFKSESLGLDQASAFSQNCPSVFDRSNTLFKWNQRHLLGAYDVYGVLRSTAENVASDRRKPTMQLRRDEINTRTIKD